MTLTQPPRDFAPSPSLVPAKQGTFPNQLTSYLKENLSLCSAAQNLCTVSILVKQNSTVPSYCRQRYFACLGPVVSVCFIPFVLYMPGKNVPRTRVCVNFFEKPDKKGKARETMYALFGTDKTTFLIILERYLCATGVKIIF
jgi:hypothetical protein